MLTPLNRKNGTSDNLENMDVEVVTNSAGDGVCRICDRNASEMHSVFEKNDEGQQLIQLIKECLPVIIYRTDPLSKEVCRDCLENLVNFYKFRKDSVNVASRQAQRLKTGVRNEAVDLYLGQVENGHDESVNFKQTLIDRTTSPFENGQEAVGVVLCSNCRNITEPEGNEIEMCAELHKAIADSLKQNNQHLEDGETKENARSVQLRSKRKRNEGFYAEFDESQDSSITTDFTYTESTQNTESQSDMELCDSDNEYRTNEDYTKRRRIMGPKSVQDSYTKERMLQILKSEQTIVYNPFTLLRLALNAINYKNVPDFWSPTCKQGTIDIERSCNYCLKKFSNIKLLAVHEAEHMSIEMGVRIDDTNPWDETREDADIRNKWLESFNEDEDISVFDDETSELVSEHNDDSVDGDLLVPVSTHSAMKGEVVLVDGKAMVNGVPLTEIPKDERRALYQSITISGVKRKFCPICRYTFKDNWAIESHYFSSSCQFTCRYCGIRFNKQRYQFEEHIREHKEKGDEVSTKMFAPRKWNTSYPRVINETKLKPRPPPKVREPPQKIKTVDMKHLLERKSLQPNLRMKNEHQNDTQQQSPVLANPTPTNQAYFCRKCYQVFFMLDEFNKHVTQCKGQTQNNVQKQQQPQQQYHQQNNHHKPSTPIRNNKSGNSSSISNTTTNSSDTETYSATGRPMRHCVREIGPYKDAPEIEPVERTYGSHLRSSRGFECGQCDAAFPNIHSRNSHMRIHKNEELTNSYEQRSYEDEYEDDGYSVKQEPLEPIVEIDENPHGFPSSIGSVSITPIPKANINPNIMKLVQNNPHLTIKSMSGAGGGGGAGGNGNYSSSPSSSSVIDLERSYKCANCSRQFANKSNLYFHKKNQCGGSKYPCPFCKKRFGTEAAYSSHIFYSHPE